MEFVLLGVITLLIFRDWYRDKSVDAERESWTKERADLLQRIQAPSVAVMSHATPEDHVPVQGAPAMSDAELWKIFETE